MFEILKCLFLSHVLLLTPEPITLHGSLIIRGDVVAINDGAYVYIDVTSMINHKDGNVDYSNNILDTFPIESIKATFVSTENKEMNLVYTGAYSIDSSKRISLLLRFKNTPISGTKFKSVRLESDRDMKDVLVYWVNCSK